MADSPRKKYSRLNTVLVPPHDLVIIGVDTTHKSRDEHPLFDERMINIDEEKVAALAATLQTQGFAHNVTVISKKYEDLGLEVPEWATRPSAYVVIAGRHRVLASRLIFDQQEQEGMAIRINVPTSPKQQMSDKDALALSIAENEVRFDVNPINKAHQIADLMNRVGYSMDQIMVMFGRTEASIQRYLSLLELDEQIQKKIETGEFSMTAGLRFAKASLKRQRMALKKLEEAKAAGNIPKMTDAAAQDALAGGTVIKAPDKRRLKRVWKKHGEDIVDVSIPLKQVLAYMLEGQECDALKEFIELVKNN
jgi:ParB-like chromosome segregation protein Spo0J